MAHWLMKSEPGSYGWDDLVRDGGTEWDGVRNPAARLHLKAMKAGDEAFFYHSGERALGRRDHAHRPRRRGPTRRTPTGSRSRSSRCGRSAPSP